MSFYMPNSNLSHTYNSNRATSDFEESASSLIFDLETRRYDAMLSGDVKALNSIFADSLNYMHSNAVLDNKDEYINKISTGRIAYLSINAFDVDIGARDDHALLFVHLCAQAVLDVKLGRDSCRESGCRTV